MTALTVGGTGDMFIKGQVTSLNHSSSRGGKTAAGGIERSL